MRKLSYEEITERQQRLARQNQNSCFPIYVVAENIRSLHNVGAIFRTSDSGRITRLFLCGFSGQPPRDEINKTALGAVKTVSWEYHRKAIDVIRSLKAQGVTIVVLEHTDHSIAYTTADYQFPLCLVIGNEVDGVSEEIVTLTDQAIAIPMYGSKQSLNVSVAYGVVLFHLIDRFNQSVAGNKKL